MILADFQISNHRKLDSILVRLCEMVVAGQQQDQDLGMVAAAVLDPDNRCVVGINYPTKMAIVFTANVLPLTVIMLVLERFLRAALSLQPVAHALKTWLNVRALTVVILLTKLVSTKSMLAIKTLARDGYANGIT